MLFSRQSLDKKKSSKLKLCVCRVQLLLLLSPNPTSSLMLLKPVFGQPLKMGLDSALRSRHYGMLAKRSSQTTMSLMTQSAGVEVEEDLGERMCTQHSWPKTHEGGCEGVARRLRRGEAES